MSQSAPPKPPPPTFATFFAQVDEGRLAATATEELEKLVAELRVLAQAPGSKPRGRVSLTFELEAVSGAQLVNVTAEVKVKMPRRPKVQSTFWPTKQNCLSAMNPQQLEIPGVDVTSLGASGLRVVGS